MIAASTLLKKYDVPGPRYTSYPTILHWENEPTVANWIRTLSDSLEATERSGTGAAIYIHIPFCRSLCTYCGCNSRITASTTVGSAYVRSVLREWYLYRKSLNRSKPLPLTELHLGGGTPTFLAPAELEELISGILKDVRRTPESEFSIESDPRVTQTEHLSTLYDLGFRRLSLGIQDFDPVVQKAVNRIQSEEQVAKVTETARAAGFNSINYDLIYGLPFQTSKSIEKTMDAVMRLKPDRIAFYGYAHVPWVKPGQRHFSESDLPAGEAKRSLYELGRSLLESFGYREIGMDHFALESDSLWRAAVDGHLHRNFMGYISRYVAPLIGLGVSSISDSWSCFVQNEKHLEIYEERVLKGEIPIMRGHQLSEEDIVLRRHILNLMTRLETEWKTTDSYVPYLDTLCFRLAEPLADGLVKLGESRCEITPPGRAFLRNICMAFDSKIGNIGDESLFSRTI